MKKWWLGEQGSSILQVIIFASVMMIALFASVKFIIPVSKQASKINAKMELYSVMQNLKSCIREGSAWHYTVQDPGNTSMACLREGQLCPNNSGGPIRLRDNLNEFCLGYNSLDESAGFTSIYNADRDSVINDWFSNNMPCFAGDKTNTGGYDPDNWNDACPFRVNISWQGSCPGGEDLCSGPIIKVTAEVTHALRNKVIKVGSDSKMSNQMLANLNLNYLKVEVTKGLTDVKKHRLVIYETRPEGEDGGECTPNPGGAGVPRKFNTVQVDSGDRLLVSPPVGTGDISLKAGTYHCDVSAPAFLVNRHHISLDLGGLPFARGSSEYAPDIAGFSVNRSHLRTKFRIENQQTIRIEHHCWNNPGDTAAAQKTMGVSTGQGREVYAIIDCEVTEIPATET